MSMLEQIRIHLKMHWSQFKYEHKQNKNKIRKKGVKRNWKNRNINNQRSYQFAIMIMCVLPVCEFVWMYSMCRWSHVVALSPHINKIKQQQQLQRGKNIKIITTTKSARNQNKIELSGKAYCEFAFVRFRNIIIHSVFGALVRCTRSVCPLAFD